jgi:hypothetical protein
MEAVAAAPRRVLVVHAAQEAFAPRTRLLFHKLGYSILDPDEFASLESTGTCEGPDLRIVDERCLAEVPEDRGPAVPIVVLSGRHGVTGADPRIVGAVRRPAGLHELYRLVQQVLEETPRTSPRVATHLAVRCRAGEREWTGAVLSLSENGCLMRAAEAPALGTRLDVSFTLPRAGLLRIDAEIAYQLVPDLGLVFNGTSPAVREAIRGFVQDALAAR